jgi:hypothetical protein
MSSDYQYEQALAWKGWKMSSPYCDGTEELYEQCPKCGTQWEGECPRTPDWFEYHCDHCGYCEGTYYDSEPVMLVEGDPALQHDNPLRPRGD